jgi:Tfp pilus assembly protein PilF
MDRAWYGLGLAALKTGALDEAEHALRQCTRLQPMAPPPWYQLARMLAEQGRGDEARAVIARLRRVEPRAAAQAARETGLEAAA